MDRGIFATIYATPKGPAVEHDLLDLYRAFYARSPFVRVVGHLPATKDSAFTNFCDITVRVVRGRIVILACLDNLIKGAAGVAVQNFNLMFGHPETTALSLNRRSATITTRLVNGFFVPVAKSPLERDLALGLRRRRRRVFVLLLLLGLGHGWPWEGAKREGDLLAPRARS